MYGVHAMRTILIVFAATLFGCQTWGPTWSEVTGERYYATTLNRFPASILLIDGYSPTQQRPVKLEPGRHVLALQSRGYVRDMTLEVAPCKRYYVNVQYASPIVPEFSGVVDYVEDIAGCTVVAAK